MNTITRVCLFCQEEFQYLAKRKNMEGRGKYCSRSCRSKNQPKILKGKEVVCPVCQVTAYINPARLKRTKSGVVFCSVDCKNVAARLDGIKEIHPAFYGAGDAYRTKALRHYGEVCASCGFNQEVKMLDVDHIDSNRRNNKIENLQILCVWCHALKTRKVLVPQSRIELDSCLFQKHAE